MIYKGSVLFSSKPANTACSFSNTCSGMQLQLEEGWYSIYTHTHTHTHSLRLGKVLKIDHNTQPLVGVTIHSTYSTRQEDHSRQSSLYLPAACPAAHPTE